MSRELLARAWQAGAGPGDAPFTIDLDSTSARPTDWPRHHGYTGPGAITRCWPSPPNPGLRTTARGAAHFLRDGGAGALRSRRQRARRMDVRFSRSGPTPPRKLPGLPHRRRGRRPPIRACLQEVGWGVDCGQAADKMPPRYGPAAGRLWTSAAAGHPGRFASSDGLDRARVGRSLATLGERRLSPSRATCYTGS